MSEVPVIPQYPGAVPLNGRETPVPGGGGGTLRNWATDDAPEAVAAYFGERLGAGAPAPGAPWPAAWHLSAPDGGEHHVEVWPADGAYPFRDDVVAPPPPGARTVVHEISYVRPRIDEAHAAPHAAPYVAPHAAPYAAPVAIELRPVSTRWQPPTAAWALALILGAAIVLFVVFVVRLRR